MTKLADMNPSQLGEFQAAIQAAGGDLVARRGSQTWEERLIREGIPVSIDGSGNATSPAVVTTATNLVTTSALRMTGFVTYVDSIMIEVGQPCAGLIGISGTPFGGGIPFPQWRKLFAIGNQGGGTRTYAVRRVFRPFEVALSAFQLTCTNYLGTTPGTDKIPASVTVQSVLMTDDFNYNAAKTIMLVGDSIGALTGATKTAFGWPMIARDYLRAQGEDVRIVLKALGGTTTGDHETLRQGGFHDISSVNVCFYALGMNNANQSIATASGLADMQSFWNWFKFRYPGKMMVVIGPSPAENNTTETNLVALRAAAADWVTSVNSPLLKFISLADAFDRTQGLAVYLSTDTAGSRIHPNDAGHAAVAAKFNAGWTAQGLKIPV